MKLQNLKIRTRLFLGFGIIIILIVVMGILSYQQINQLWFNTDQMYKHPFKVSNTVRDIRADIIAMHRSMKDIALAENKEQITHASNLVNNYEAEVYRLFDVVYKNYLGKRTDIDTAYFAFINWKQNRDEVIRLRLAGKSREAAKITMGKGARYVEFMMGKIRRMIDFASNKGAEFYYNAASSKNSLQLHMEILLLLILIAGITISMVISKSTVEPLDELTKVSEQLLKGNLNVRSALTSKDETGYLARTINKLADSVQHQVRVRNGVTKLTDVMIKETAIKPFSEKLLKEMMDLTKSNVGAVYLLNEEKALFEHLISIGLMKEKISNFSAEILEGEFGAAIANKKIIHITDIPDDSVFELQTISGTFKPAEIITIPILGRERVEAMLSIASIKKYSAEALEIIDYSWQSLNTGFSNSLLYEETRNNAETLNEQNKTLSDQAEKLKLQADELKQQANELQTQNIELEIQGKQINEANRLKSEFLSNVSHELRTPLNSVITLSNILYKKLKGKIPDKEYGYLNIIERNGKHLLELINDVLDLSKIESGRVPLEYSSFNIAGILDSILLTFKPQVKQKKLTIEKNVPANLHLLTSDSSKCHHILQNIIGNAVKFTEKGKIKIDAHVKNNQMIISVSDTGIGIPGDHLPYIFDEFRQVEGATYRRYEGTGLGLAIVKEYTKLLGGNIEVESNVGKGSVFTLQLPLKPKDISVLENDDLLTSQFEIEGKISNHKIKPAIEGTRILLVEDSEAAIIQISEILKEQGYSVDVACNGKEALDHVKKQIPDGIILDLMMPELDGFEVLEQIRSKSETKKIPVLILTAKDLTVQELKRLSSNHIQQLVRKGDVNKRELLLKVQMMLSSQPKELNIPRKIKQTSKDKDDSKKPVRILVVEDNRDNLETIIALLENKYEIISAIDGEAGINSAIDNLPNLILLDISLPKMDGFEVFNRIRKEAELQDVPVIAVTASAMKENREEIISFGFNDYISKPIAPDVLLHTIEKWL